MNVAAYFLLLVRASLFTTGGMANVPILHDDFLPRGWATERMFAESLAVGQISPGPNGLWVICLGYFMDGLRGALLALLAIMIPPLLVLPLDRLYHRVKEHPAVEGLIRGLGTAVVGVFAVVLIRLFTAAGPGALTLTIAFLAFVLSMTRRVPPLLIIGAAALTGLLAR